MKTEIYKIILIIKSLCKLFCVIIKLLISCYTTINMRYTKFFTQKLYKMLTICMKFSLRARNLKICLYTYNSSHCIYVYLSKYK